MKVLFMPTLNAPVVHYRMANFVTQLRKLGHEVAFSYWNQDYIGTCQWERELKADGIETEFIKEIDELCNVAEVIVFQIIHMRAALALFWHYKTNIVKSHFLLNVMMISILLVQKILPINISGRVRLRRLWVMSKSLRPTD